MILLVHNHSKYTKYTFIVDIFQCFCSGFISKNPISAVRIYYSRLITNLKGGSITCLNVRARTRGTNIPFPHAGKSVHVCVWRAGSLNIRSRGLMCHIFYPSDPEKTDPAFARPRKGIELVSQL